MRSRQHFLAAGFLGGFSLETTVPARERTLWARRRGYPGGFATNAESVGWRYDMFTGNPGVFGAGADDPYVVDRHMGMTDARINAAIGEMDSGTLSAHTWVATFVPFVTSLFVRGADFAGRYEARLQSLLGVHPRELGLGSDNTNGARLIEMQRLFAPVLHAEWTVLRNASSIPLLQNDLGYVLTYHGQTRRRGYTVPLRVDLAVGVMQGPVGVQVVGGPNGPALRGLMEARLDDNAVRSLNAATAALCQTEVYGATQALVEENELAPAPPSLLDPAASLLIQPGFKLRDHEMEWLRLLTAVSVGERDRPSIPFVIWRGGR